MKNKFLLLLMLIFLYSYGNSQNIKKQLKNYNYQWAESILIDSIFKKDPTIGRGCFLNSTKDSINLQLKIVPVCRFSDKAKKYNKKKSISSFLEIDTTQVFAFVFVDNNFVGSLSGFKSNLLSIDTEERLGYFHWVPAIESYALCIRTNKSFKPDSLSFLFVNNLITENYFLLSTNFYEIWFFENKQLKAYSKFNNKVYEEKTYIDGIREVMYGDKHVYYIDHDDEIWDEIWN